MSGKDLGNLLKRIAPELGLEKSAGLKILTELLMAVRKDAFSEAAEIVEDLYITCHMPITEIVRHLKMSK